MSGIAAGAAGATGCASHAAAGGTLHVLPPPHRPPPQAEASGVEVNANELARTADEISFNMILILMIVKQVAARLLQDVTSC